MFKIFVGNLDYKVRPEQVRELFALYAPIEDLVLPTDPKTNKPRGFAIVMIRDPELGAAAVRGVQGKRLLGRELVVNEALKKKGKAAPPAPEPARSGPFGPRMFRKSDARARGNRNPRRSAAGGLGGAPPTASDRGSAPRSFPASRPSGQASNPPSPTSRSSASGRQMERPSPPGPPPVETTDRPQSPPSNPAVKARPKSPPPSP